MGKSRERAALFEAFFLKNGISLCTSVKFMYTEDGKLFFALFLAAQLSAGCVYVSSERSSDCRAYSVVLKRFRKFNYCLLARGRKSRFCDGVYGYKIYVNREAVAS